MTTMLTNKNLESLLMDAADSGRFTSSRSLVSARRKMFAFQSEVLSEGYHDVVPFQSWLDSTSSNKQAEILDAPFFRAVTNRLMRRIKRSEYPCPIELSTYEFIRSDFDNGNLLDSLKLIEMGDHEVVTYRFIKPSALPKNSAQLLSEIFDDQVKQHFPADDLEVCDASIEVMEVVKTALSILGTLIPELYNSVMPHVNNFVMAGRSSTNYIFSPEDPSDFLAASSLAIPGCIFLTPSLTTSVWRACETVFHEACHQKMFDIVATQGVYPPGYKSDQAIQVASIWNTTPNGGHPQWATDRALFAAHVYVYLCIYYIALQLRTPAQSFADPDFPECQMAFKKARFRADYLLNRLKQDCVSDLGRSGVIFLDWLIELLRKTECFASESGLEW